jgi:membrane associated rhomboid family serine protease
MARRNHAAGGFFLILAILGGFAWGAMSGLPVEGAVVGTLIGIVLALLVWLIDRRRR